MPARVEHIKRIVIANYRASPVKSLILAVGAVALLFMVVRQLSGGAPKADAATPINRSILPDQSQSVDGAQQSVGAEQRLPKPSITHRSPRDLFGTEWLEQLPLATGASDVEAGAADKEHELELQFTITGPTPPECTAVISGVVVHPGSVIEGYTVEEIADRAVVLHKGTERRTLRMQ